MAKKRVKKEDLISLMEANAIMGERIYTTLRDDLTPEQRQEENEQSAIVLGFAKQVINLADVTLRAEKLMAQNKALIDSRINALVGELDG
jgi:hypothetical protein